MCGTGKRLHDAAILSNWCQGAGQELGKESFIVIRTNRNRSAANNIHPTNSDKGEAHSSKRSPNKEKGEPIVTGERNQGEQAKEQAWTGLSLDPGLMVAWAG